MNPRNVVARKEPYMRSKQFPPLKKSGSGGGGFESSSSNNFYSLFYLIWRQKTVWGKGSAKRLYIILFFLLFLAQHFLSDLAHRSHDLIIYHFRVGAVLTRKLNLRSVGPLKFANVLVYSYECNFIIRITLRGPCEVVLFFIRNSCFSYWAPGQVIA